MTIFGSDVCSSDRQRRPRSPRRNLGRYLAAGDAGLYHQRRARNRRHHPRGSGTTPRRPQRQHQQQRRRATPEIHASRRHGRARRSNSAITRARTAVKCAASGTSACTARSTARLSRIPDQSTWQPGALPQVPLHLRRLGGRQRPRRHAAPSAPPIPRSS